MKIGDKIVMSKKNINAHGQPCAFGGYEGTVSVIYDDDGAFIVQGETSTLVVPANNHWGIRRKGTWIHLNGEHLFYRFKQPKGSWIKRTLKYIFKFITQ